MISWASKADFGKYSWKSLVKSPVSWKNQTSKENVSGQKTVVALLLEKKLASSFNIQK